MYNLVCSSLFACTLLIAGVIGIYCLLLYFRVFVCRIAVLVVLLCCVWVYGFGFQMCVDLPLGYLQVGLLFVVCEF